MAEVGVGGLEGPEHHPGSFPSTPDSLFGVRAFPPVRGAETILWRGYGGGVPTLHSVEFDRQLDKVSIWLEQWDHKERCNILETLIECCKLHQFRLLWTVVQPALHRDFMYTAKKHFPALKFMPISSHASRELKKKMAFMRTDNYHRISSAHLQHYDQLKEVMSEVKLPEISVTKSCHIVSQEKEAGGEAKGEVKVKEGRLRDFRNRPGLRRANTMGCLHPSPRLPEISQGSLGNIRSRTDAGIQAVIFDGQTKTCLDLIQKAPPTIRFIEMPMRRHIQDEEGPGHQTERRGESPSSPLPHHCTSPATLSSKNSVVSEAASSVQSVGGGNISKLSPEAAQVLTWFSEQWTDTQRNEFLHKFLLKLDPRQHYYISSLLAVKHYRDFLALLPRDISLRILSYLSPRKIVRTSRVSKTWWKLCNSNELWRLKCQELQIEISLRGENPDWKTIFRENRHIKRNWRSGKCKTFDIKGHTDKVLAVAFDETRIATGSADRTVRLWDIKDGRCLTVLKGHLRGVWCLRFFTKNLLISGSYDCTIKIWNLREGSCTRTLLGHEGPVWAIVRRDTTMVSASQDRNAKVWDISRCLLLHTLKGHNAAVFAVDMDEDRSLVITGSADRSVRLWDAENGRQRKVIWASQTTSIMSVSFSRCHLACSFGTTILVYKVDLDGTSSRSRHGEPSIACKLLKTYEEHNKRIETVQLKMKEGSRPRGTLLSAGKDGVIKYWDINRDKSVQTYSGHNRAVNCVQCDETRLVSASYDNKVKIWDFSVI